MEDLVELIYRFFMGRGLIILAASYVAGESIKLYFPKYKRWIPLAGGLLGLVLGIMVPSVFEGADILTKAVYGLALGWAATGIAETMKVWKNR